MSCREVAGAVVASVYMLIFAIRLVLQASQVNTVFTRPHFGSLVIRMLVNNDDSQYYERITSGRVSQSSCGFSQVCGYHNETFVALANLQWCFSKNWTSPNLVVVIGRACLFDSSTKQFPEIHEQAVTWWSMEEPLLDHFYNHENQKALKGVLNCPD